LHSQTIHAVYDFRDRPIEGFADFEGVPHHFKCEFNDEGEYSDVYCLTPISADMLRLVVERQRIFDRWSTAFHAGQTTLDTHPALPNERARYDELDEAVSQALKGFTATASKARAKFLPDGTVEWDRLPTAK
jgi:hypothetical protein